MIIVELKGGLGNQMFQYALGKSLAETHGVPLKLDIRGYERPKRKETVRIYELNRYNIHASIATNAEIKTLQRQKRLLDIVFGRKHIYQEKSFSYDPAVFSVGLDMYVSGYWQSYKYFQDIDSMVKRDFTLIESSTDEVAKLMTDIARADSVAVHVRRGDYVSNAHANAFHGVCSLGYYHEAIRYIKSQIETPHFFVFSDDIPWCRANLSLPNSVRFMDYSGRNTHEDMRLMRACKHFIIANSTFSWWGAWLSSYSKKIVVAPKQWFQAQEIKQDDLIPPNWIVL
jgi:hypothetical protein